MPRPRARPRGKAPATNGRVGHELPRPADRRRAASAGPDGGGRRHRLCRAPPGAWGGKRALGRRRPRLPPVRGPSLAPAGPSGLEHARRPVPGHGPASGRRRRAPGRRRPARPRPGDRRHCGGGIARRPGTTARGMALVVGPRPGGSVGNPAPPARFAHRRRGATSVARNRSRTCGSRSATSAAVCRPARAATAQEHGTRPNVQRLSTRSGGCRRRRELVLREEPRLSLAAVPRRSPHSRNHGSQNRTCQRSAVGSVGLPPVIPSNASPPTTICTEP